MTHSYTVCERSYDNGQYGQAEDSAKRKGGGSSRVTHISRHDPLEEELDPCLSAAVRCKKQPSSGLARLKYFLCCVIVLFAFSLLAVALLMLFDGGDSMEPLQRTTQFGRTKGPAVLSDVAGVGRANEEVENKPNGGDKYTHEPFIAKGPFRGRAVPAIVKTTTTTKRPILHVPPKTTSKLPVVVTVQPTTLATAKPKKNISESIRDCDFYRKSGKRSGVYKLSLPQGLGDFDANCLMESDYGWIVWQRRSSDLVPFWNNSFDEYAAGFGGLTSGGDGWLGLRWIHVLSELGNKLEMRIRLDGDLCEMRTKWSCSGFGDNGSWWGDWQFSLEGREAGFRINDLQFLRGNLSFNGTGLDLFSSHSNGIKFTTVDVDNDELPDQNCANYAGRGAWWHKECAHTVLNGLYGVKSPKAQGLFWNRPFPSRKTNDPPLPHGAYIIKPKKTLILVRISDH